MSVEEVGGGGSYRDSIYGRFDLR